MECSDVSEFERIYGQMSTTPSCVYYPAICLHEQEWWLLMRWSCERSWVDRHLFFDKVKSFGIDSCLYEISKNDVVDDMKLCHRSRSPMCTVTSSSRR